MSEELKPCPVCKRSDKLRRSFEPKIEITTVSCMRCGVTAKSEHWNLLHPPPWIPCKERLPESHVKVLFFVRFDDGVTIIHYGWRDVISWRTSYTTGFIDGEKYYEVTHWQPLPPPPDKEGV